MQGVHAFEPKAKTSIDFESFVAEGHFLRRIARSPRLLDCLELLRKEVFNHLLTFRRSELRTFVASAGDRLHCHLDARVDQGLGQDDALAQWNQPIGVAVHNQEGRVTLVDIGQRIGGAGQIEPFLHGAAQKARFGRVGGIVLDHAAGARLLPHDREVGGAEPVHHGLHAARDVGITQIAFHLLHVAAGAHKGGQMPAGRITAHSEVIGVEIVFGRVGAQKRTAALQSYACSGQIASWERR